MQCKSIHIFNNDKFVDSAIALIEAVCPNQSSYFVIADTLSGRNYVQTKSVQTCVLQSESDLLEFSQFLNEQENSVLWFHALDAKKQRLVSLLSDQLLKVWLIWGYDLYGNFLPFNKHMYADETRKLLQHQPSSFKLKMVQHPWAYRLFDAAFHSKIKVPKRLYQVLAQTFDTPFYRAIQKMDIVVPILPVETPFIHQLRIYPQIGRFSYGCLEELLVNSWGDNVLGAENILVGNSADPSNNHLEVFQKLATLDLKDRKVYVPLSYGGTELYVEKIKQLGAQLLGDNFAPLTDFMPLDAYNSILKSCGYMILNHIRQQAVGNVVSGGYLGMKIFMNVQSPVYTFFSQKGMRIFTADSLSQKQIDSHFSYSDLDNNRNVIQSEYSKEAVLEKIRSLFELIDKNCQN